MSIYKCNAVIEENKECGRSCWGKTIYCMWHNCWLTWYCLYLYIFPHNRSIGWVYYDRDFLKDMRPSPIISTMSAITGIGFLCLFTVVFYLIGINKYYRSQSFLEIFTKSIWIVAFVCILTMALGNKKIIFPKLLLGFSIVLIILQLIRINLTNNWGFENISILCGRFALFFWAIPIPRGPLINTMVDVFDSERLPPFNIGALIVRTIGGILFIIHQVGQYI